MTTMFATPIPSSAPQPQLRPEQPQPCYAIVWLSRSPLAPCSPRWSPRTLEALGTGRDDSWLAACYRLTPRLERLDATRALLDLGACTAAEAHAAALSLLHHLDLSNMPDNSGQGLARIGLGPSPLLAQLALLSTSVTPTTPRIATITLETMPATLRALPVLLLPRLHPAGAITAEMVERLEGYGLRTLGQIARLGEPALRRQFGDRLGALLGTVAAGGDIRPLLPTPQPATRRFRLPFAPAVPPERALAALPAMARWIARCLADERLQASTLRLLLVWESGVASSAQARLRAPVCVEDQLARHFQRLAAMLIYAEEAPVERDMVAAAPSRDDLWVSDVHTPQWVARIVAELADLRPLAESQGVFWETTARKRAALAELADTLARHYARPPLLRAVRTRPDAIFRAERYELRPLGDEPLDDGDHTGWAAGTSPLPGALLAGHAVTPWDAVPHRLHWW